MLRIYPFSRAREGILLRICPFVHARESILLRIYPFVHATEGTMLRIYPFPHLKTLKISLFFKQLSKTGGIMDYRPIPKSAFWFQKALEDA